LRKSFQLSFFAEWFFRARQAAAFVAVATPELKPAPLACGTRRLIGRSESRNLAGLPSWRCREKNLRFCGMLANIFNVADLTMQSIKPGKLTIFVFAALALPARSDLIYTLTQDGCSGNCGPQAGGFGTVDLSQISSTEVQVTVTLSHGNKFVKTGNHDALTFDVSGAAVTLSNFTTGFSQDSSPSNPPFNPFSDGVTCSGCGPGASSPLPGPLVFDVTRSGGLSVNNFVANSDNIYFASDIISGTSGKTGAVGAQGPGALTTPEPSLYLMLALGLIAIIAVVWRTSAPSESSPAPNPSQRR